MQPRVAIDAGTQVLHLGAVYCLIQAHSEVELWLSSEGSELIEASVERARDSAQGSNPAPAACRRR